MTREADIRTIFNCKELKTADLKYKVSQDFIRSTTYFWVSNKRVQNLAIKREVKKSAKNHLEWVSMF